MSELPEGFLSRMMVGRARLTTEESTMIKVGDVKIYKTEVKSI